MGDSGKSRAAELLIRGASEVLTGETGARGRSGSRMRRIPAATVAVGGGRILAVGTEAEVRDRCDCAGAEVLEAEGGAVAPGFVDAHTHVVFGGSRMREYAARLTQSRSEVEVMGIPTGIMATVEMTRGEDPQTLYESAALRLDDMLAHGTTTAESKSGYGLDVESELKLLRVNRELDRWHPVDVVSTFMGAHDFPPELDREEYVRLIIQEMIPRVADEGLAAFCDAFCDEGYFTVDQSRRILEAGLAAGLAPKIHADQYSNPDGASLAAEIGATSADHLNYSAPEALRRMAGEGVVAVLMPLIDFAVQHPKPIRGREWIEAGLEVALGTDVCPGGYAVSMPLALQFACRWNGLSPEEALYAGTLGAAHACGLDDRGRIEPGAVADLQIWDVASLEEMVYRIGHNPVRTVVKNGKVVV